MITPSLPLLLNVRVVSSVELPSPSPKLPPTVTLPVVVIASIYAFAQYNELVPRSRALSVDGSKLSSNLATDV